MLRHYLRTAVRHLLRRKGYAFINVAGLAVGAAACLLILLYVRFERSYDRFHDQADRIYRVAWISERPQTRTPHPMAQALVRDFPEVEHAVSLSPIWGPGLTRPTFSVRYEDRRFDEREVYAADSTFFDVFSFRLLRGDPATALKVPGGILLSQSAATRYFGRDNPVGKVLTIDDDTELTVTGVLEDLPAESHFHFDFLVSYVTMKQGDHSGYYAWEDFGHYNYVVLAEGADARAVEARLGAWSRRYVDWPEELWEAYLAGRIGFRLQPLAEIHLRSHLMWELEPNGYAAYVYTLTAAALFILVIACVNFMNLSTARALDRAKEVGVRKAAGASRRQLALQFVGEAVLLAVVAALGALVLTALFLPAFRALTGVDLRAGTGGWDLWLALGAGVLGVGLLAGSYPALVLSAFRPVDVLKGSFRTRPAGRLLRQGLVVFQFALSIALVIGTLVVGRQLHYLRTADLGFTAEQVVVLPLPEGPLRAQVEAFKEALRTGPGVVQAAAASNVPGDRFNQNAIRWAGHDEAVSASELRADYDVVEVLGLTMAEGRGFSRDHPGDADGALVVNEAAARHLGGAPAVGQELAWDVEAGPVRRKVVGVIRDFHFQTLREAVAPLVVSLDPGAYNYLLVRIRPGDVAQTLAHVEATWKAFEPARAFTYSFLGQDLAALYRAEERLGRVLGAFAALALVIACLGLFGLATFAAEQRRREIGVRKVLGATAAGLVARLSADFAGLVVLAFVAAAPAAYAVMDAWLGDFATRIVLERQAAVFALAGLGALALALATVSYRAVRAATANPVDALRSE